MHHIAIIYLTVKQSVEQNKMNQINKLTSIQNYLNRHNVTFTIVADAAPQESKVAIVVRKNYWIDVYVMGELVKTCTQNPAVRAAIRSAK
jgi:hypothetical protein